MAKKSKVKPNSKPAVASQKYFTNCKSYYSCIHCRAHIANHDEIVSRSFQGNVSRAYLYNTLVNVSNGPTVNRELTTGPHAVADLFCSVCKTKIGWKYEKAFVESQRYKEGKFIVEMAHVIRENKHLELDRGERILRREMRRFSLNGDCIGASAQLSSGKDTAKTAPQSAGGQSSATPLFALVRRYSSGQNPATSVTNNNSIEISTHSQSFNDGRRQLGSSSSPPSAVPMQKSATTAANSNNNNNNNGHYVDHNNYVDVDKGFYDLNSPVYDDIYTKLLVYPSTLSHSYSRRIKRELFSNSKPYDWKCKSPVSSSSSSSTAAAFNQHEPSTSKCFDDVQRASKRLALNSAGSLSPAFLSSPSTSSRSSSPPNFSLSSRRSSCGSKLKRKLATVDSSSGNKGTAKSSSDTNEETQFDFEEASVAQNAADINAANSANNRFEYQSSDIQSLSLKSLSLDDGEYFDCSAGHELN